MKSIPPWEVWLCVSLLFRCVGVSSPPLTLLFIYETLARLRTKLTVFMVSLLLCFHNAAPSSTKSLHWGFYSLEQLYNCICECVANVDRFLQLIRFLFRPQFWILVERLGTTAWWTACIGTGIGSRPLIAGLSQWINTGVRYPFLIVWLVQ